MTERYEHPTSLIVTEVSVSLLAGARLTFRSEETVGAAAASAEVEFQSVIPRVAEEVKIGMRYRLILEKVQDG